MHGKIYRPPLTRRSLLTMGLGVGITARFGLAQGLRTQEQGWILLGTQDGEGVYRARWDATSGTIGKAELAIATPRPSYIAMHPRLPVLYACNEHDGAAATLSAFSLNRQLATLTPLAVQQTHGNSPCFVAVDRSGRLLFTANYGGGSLSAFPLDHAGRPAPRADLFRCAESSLCGQPGPVAARQDGAHLHCAVPAPDAGSVLACDLGDDAILIFPVHPGSTQPLGKPVRLAARKGSGPRHLAFAPDGESFLCIHELDCSVDVYNWPGSKRALAGGARRLGEPVFLAPTAAAPTTGNLPNTAAEIACSRDGRFVYTSTRGVNQLSVLQRESQSAMPHIVQQLPCGGETPRFFALDPSERWLLCANQNSSTVTVFARDGASGHLQPCSKQDVPSPMCIVWV